MRLITLPQQHPQEIELLKEALQLPDLVVHLRKPAATKAEMQTYLRHFTAEERQRLVLHQQQELALALGMQHLHLTTAQRLQGDLPTARLAELNTSTSTHSWAEFNALSPLFKAAFISPVFPSISKEGYRTTAQLSNCGERRNQHTKAVALGGIDACRLTEIKDKGFDDYALCGAIWHSNNPIKALTTCYSIIHLSSL